MINTNFVSEYFSNYEGYFRAGLPNGKGILTLQNWQYIGDFENGKFNGNGEL